MEDLLAYDLVVGLEEPISEQSSSLSLSGAPTVATVASLSATTKSNGTSSSSSSSTSSSSSSTPLPNISILPALDKLKPSLITPYPRTGGGGGTNHGGNSNNPKGLSNPVPSLSSLPVPSFSTAGVPPSSTTRKAASSFPSNLPSSHEYSDFTNVTTNATSSTDTPKVPSVLTSASSLTVSSVPKHTGMIPSSSSSSSSSSVPTPVLSASDTASITTEDVQQQQQTLIHELREQLLTEKERRRKLNFEILQLKEKLSNEEKSSIAIIAKLETEYETLKHTYHLHLEEMQITNALLEEKEKALKNQERSIDDIRFQKDCLTGDISELHSQLKEAQEATVSIHNVLKEERKEFGVMKEKYSVAEQRINELLTEIETFRSNETNYHEQLRSNQHIIQHYQQIMEEYGINSNDIQSNGNISGNLRKRSIDNTSVSSNQHPSSESTAKGTVPSSSPSSLSFTSRPFLTFSELPSSPTKLSIAQLQQRKDALIEVEHALQDHRNKIATLEAENLSIKAQYNALLITHERLSDTLQQERNQREETETNFAKERAAHELDNRERSNIEKLYQQCQGDLHDVKLRCTTIEHQLEITNDNLQQMEEKYTKEYHQRLELNETILQLQQLEKQYQETIHQKDEQLIALQAEVQHGRLTAQELRNDLDKAAAFGSALLQSNKDNQQEILKLRHSITTMNHTHNGSNGKPAVPLFDPSTAAALSSLLSSSSMVSTSSTVPHTHPQSSSSSVATVPSTVSRKPETGLTTSNIFSHYASLISHPPQLSSQQLPSSSFPYSRSRSVVPSNIASIPSHTTVPSTSAIPQPLFSKSVTNFPVPVPAIEPTIEPILMHSLRSHLHDYDLLSAELNEAINTAFLHDIQQPMVHAHLLNNSTSSFVNSNVNHRFVPTPVSLPSASLNSASSATAAASIVLPNPYKDTNNSSTMNTVTVNPSLYSTRTVTDATNHDPINDNNLRPPSSSSAAASNAPSTTTTTIDENIAILATQALQDELQHESLARLAAEAEIEKLLQQLQISR